MKKVRHISDKTNDSRSISVDQLMDLVDDRINEDFGKYNKAIVILLDDKEEKYDIRHFHAGLRCSDSISLLEVVKTVLLEDILK